MAERNAASTHQLISINDASEAELAELAKIGPRRAHAIVEHRREHGRFASVEELAQLEGFGPMLPRELREELTC